MENSINENDLEVKLEFDSDHMEEPEGGDSLYDGTAEELEPAPASTPIKDLPDSVKRRIKIATWFAKQGCGILRVHPGAKKPSEQGWQIRLLTEGYAIHRMLSTRDSAGNFPNYGICPREGMVVVDTDNGMKGGRQRTGEKNLTAAGDLPPTVMSETPSGGFHRFYRIPAAVTNSHKLPEDVDVRGQTGQVVGIGCELIEGLCSESDTPGTYERGPDSADTIADAPAWLVAKLSLYKDKGTTKAADQRDIVAGDTEVGGDPAELSEVRDALSFINFTMRDDQDGWTGVAKSILFNQLPIFDKGERIEDDVAEELCYDAMSGRLWGERIGDREFRFSSYKGRDELKKERLSDGVQYTKGGKTLGTIFDLAKAGGWKGSTHANTIEQLRGMAPAPSADDPPVAEPAPAEVPGEEVAEIESPEDHIFNIQEFLKLNRRREFVIPRWLPAKGIVALTAIQGTGKSLILTDLAACIATNGDWQGLPIHPDFTVAVYLCGEDEDGFAMNISAWQQEHEIEIDPTRLIVSDRVMQLSDDDDVTAWIEGLKRRVGDRRAVISLDTWQRATSTTKGQSADDDMARSVNNAERLARALNGPLISAAHPPKSVKEEVDLSVMGSSVIQNTAVALWTLWDGADGLTLRVVKVRGAARGAFRKFRLEVTELDGTEDAFGQPDKGARVECFAGTTDTPEEKAARHERSLKAWATMIRMAMTAHVFTADGVEIKPSPTAVAAWIAKYADKDKLVERSDTERGWYAEIWEAAEAADITSLGKSTIREVLGDLFFPELGRLPHYDYAERDGITERLTGHRRGRRGVFKIGRSPLDKATRGCPAGD